MGWKNGSEMENQEEDGGMHLTVEKTHTSSLAHSPGVSCVRLESGLKRLRHSCSALLINHDIIGLSVLIKEINMSQSCLSLPLVLLNT